MGVVAFVLPKRSLYVIGILAIFFLFFVWVFAQVWGTTRQEERYVSCQHSQFNEGNGGALVEVLRCKAEGDEKSVTYNHHDASSIVARINERRHAEPLRCTTKGERVTDCTN